MIERRPDEEIGRLGDEIYERDIRPQVETDHHGEFLAIDVDSGCWAISDDLRDARDGLRAERPDALNVWLMRVGYRALHQNLSPRNIRRSGTRGRGEKRP